MEIVNIILESEYKPNEKEFNDFINLLSRQNLPKEMDLDIVGEQFLKKYIISDLLSLNDEFSGTFDDANQKAKVFLENFKFAINDAIKKPIASKSINFGWHALLHYTLHKYGLGWKEATILFFIVESISNKENIKTLSEFAKKYNYLI